MGGISHITNLPRTNNIHNVMWLYIHIKNTYQAGASITYYWGTNAPQTLLDLFMRIYRIRVNIFSKVLQEQVILLFSFVSMTYRSRNYKNLLQNKI
jgi:hypothetical protein